MAVKICVPVDGALMGDTVEFYDETGAFRAGLLVYKSEESLHTLLLGNMQVVAVNVIDATTARQLAQDKKRVPPRVSRITKLIASSGIVAPDNLAARNAIVKAKYRADLFRVKNEVTSVQ